MSTWETLLRGRSWGRWPAEAAVRSVARIAAGRMGLRVIEVGCGAGAQLRFLAAEGHRAVGFDIAPSAIDQARQLDHGPLPPGLGVADALDLPVRSRCADVVLDVECWVHVPGPGPAGCWEEAARVLVPGGHVVSIAFLPETTGITTGRPLGPHTVADPLTGPVAGHGVTTALPLEGVRAAVESAGLVVVDQQRQWRTVGEDELVAESVTVARLP
jgi:SAM-dependent methyltransferase